MAGLPSYGHPKEPEGKRPGPHSSRNLRLLSHLEFRTIKPKLGPAWPADGHSGETNAMKSIPVVAIAAVSSVALIAFLYGHTASYRVFAASPAQMQSEPLKNGQTQPAPGQSQQPNKVENVAPNAPPLTPIEGLQVQELGLQMEVKDLQTQVKTLQVQAASNQNSMHTLQTSLQTLQTKFANHVSTQEPGARPCTGINQYMVTQAGTGKQVQVGLEVVQACSNPKWDGATPSSWQTLNVSTPVQGAQTP